MVLEKKKNKGETGQAKTVSPLKLSNKHLILVVLNDLPDAFRIDSSVELDIVP